MKLYVYLLEGRDCNAKDSYVKIQVGKFKSKTRVVRDTDNPSWNEEFVFRVHDFEDELVLSVYRLDDGSGFFSASGVLVGRVRIPVGWVASDNNWNLPPTWFSLERPRSTKSIGKACGKLLLALSVHGKDKNISSKHILNAQQISKGGKSIGSKAASISSQDVSNDAAPSRKKIEGKQLMKAFACHFEKLFNKTDESSANQDSSELSSVPSDYEDCIDESSAYSFEEKIEMMQSMSIEEELPESLPGGILLDQGYLVRAKDLNIFLFAPNSQFKKDLAEFQGTTNVKEGLWAWKSEDKSQLVRTVAYTKAATKLLKVTKAIEDQTYIRANLKEFAVLVRVSTPDVPYGNTFEVELLYKIMPGPELSSGEESSHLEISWVINFSQSSMMRGMIEGGARQGLKESFDQFSSLLAKSFEVVNGEGISDKDHVLATLQTEYQSDWKLAIKYFGNFNVLLAIFMISYVIVHIVFCKPSKLQAFEFLGLDLPDSFGELITSGILVIQLQRCYKMVSHFIEARMQRGSDHGLKGQGDGWVLTVALIEGTNFASLSSAPDPYVVLTCNGKTRTSSVKLQTLDPQWSEILEFDATEEPPSVLDVEVFDFDGPFDQDVSLGHAEINFLKHTSTELADIWVPLGGKLALSSHSKLHLRIFLDNKNGVETIRDYLTKMEKEVGKKLNLRSPQKNSYFQKLFGLPSEEFLIDDFSCSLRRKLPLQGRLFLSARIVGFHANLFGYKVKFFFLWEDIEDIKILPPSFSSVGSPLVLIVLRKGRGVDASHGAKSHDEEGRLQFFFHSFISFKAASRTIMALWRTRILSPDQSAEIADEQQIQDENYFLSDGTGSYLITEENLSKIYTSEISVNIKSLMEMFDGGELEHKVMGKSGCLNYVSTTWEPVAPGLLQRYLSYKFNHLISIFGGEVTCTQQKSPLPRDEGWTVSEVMTLHDIPFSDHFHVQFRYQIENIVKSPNLCKFDVYVGIKWLKATKFEQRMSRNITDKFSNRLKEIFELVEHEILVEKQ